MFIGYRQHHTYIECENDLYDYGCEKGRPTRWCHATPSLYLSMKNCLSIHIATYNIRKDFLYIHILFMRVKYSLAWVDVYSHIFMQLLEHQQGSHTILKCFVLNIWHRSKTARSASRIYIFTAHNDVNSLPVCSRYGEFVKQIFVSSSLCTKC